MLFKLLSIIREGCSRVLLVASSLVWGSEAKRVSGGRAEKELPGRA
jgi:hypothetical protein